MGLDNKINFQEGTMGFKALVDMLERQLSPNGMTTTWENETINIILHQVLTASKIITVRVRNTSSKQKNIHIIYSFDVYLNKRVPRH